VSPKIEHLAIWTKDLERLKDFYTHYFKASAGNMYTNQKTGFQSYFLSFACGARLELMQIPIVSKKGGDSRQQNLGYAHISFSVGSKDEVDALTSQLGLEGYAVLDGPRLTGDGYYESQVTDPDGNRIEITI
jgi:lactoylglutathione lyase